MSLLRPVVPTSGLQCLFVGSVGQVPHQGLLMAGKLQAWGMIPYPYPQKTDAMGQSTEPGRGASSRHGGKTLYSSNTLINFESDHMYRAAKLPGTWTN